MLTALVTMRTNTPPDAGSETRYVIHDTTSVLGSTIDHDTNTAYDWGPRGHRNGSKAAASRRASARVALAGMATSGLRAPVAFPESRSGYWPSARSVGCERSPIDEHANDSGSTVSVMLSARFIAAHGTRPHVASSSAGISAAGACFGGAVRRVTAPTRAAPRKGCSLRGASSAARSLVHSCRTICRAIHGTWSRRWRPSSGVALPSQHSPAVFDAMAAVRLKPSGHDGSSSSSTGFDALSPELNTVCWLNRSVTARMAICRISSGTHSASRRVSPQSSDALKCAKDDRVGRTASDAAVARSVAMGTEPSVGNSPRACTSTSSQ